MDWLYSKYSNPLEFMTLYIEQGQFGKFVYKIIEQKKKEQEKESEEKLWQLYLYSYPDKSFDDWKRSVLLQNTNDKKEIKTTKDIDMTEEDIVGIIDNLFKG